jgi:membrane protein implicated in regulation of membrane protease activity
VYVLPAQRILVRTGKNILIGQVGVARTDLAPGGNVQMAGELWSAKVQDGEQAIPAGTRVKVVKVDGIHLRVEREA